MRLTVPADFLLSYNILDPMTKYNVEGYIIKNNGDMKVSYTNMNIITPKLKMTLYYYKKIKGKNIKIMCLEDEIEPSKNLNVIPSQVYTSLKSTKRINDTLFVVELDYQRKYINEKVEDCKKKYYFRYVSDRQYEMYKDIEEENKKRIEETKIFRPKKQENSK